MEKRELRQDLVSGDWVLVSTGRGKRPHQFKHKSKLKRAPKLGCPFENPKEAGGGGVLLSLPNEKNWTLQVVPNKYPIVVHADGGPVKNRRHGPFLTVPGVGHHEIMITKDHDANFPRLKLKDATLVLKAFRERYNSLKEDENLEYISNFHNWGPRSGASIYHPHYQILGIPVVPPDVAYSLDGSLKYFRKHKKCVHGAQITWERKQKKRIILEDKNVIAFAPFVSKEPFEMRVFVKKHNPFFEESSDEELKSVAKVLQGALKRLETAVKNVNYNFFIHTAPIKKRGVYQHYHWHIEIVPRLNISAGLELGTNIQVNSVDPNEAARLLRNARVLIGNSF